MSTKIHPQKSKKWSGAAHEPSLWCEGLWWWFALCSSSTAWLVCYLFHVPPNARAFSDRWGLLRAGRAITAASRGLRGWRGSVRFSCGRGAPRRRSSGIKTACVANGCGGPWQNLKPGFVALAPIARNHEARKRCGVAFCASREKSPKITKRRFGGIHCPDTGGAFCYRRLVFVGRQGFTRFAGASLPNITSSSVVVSNIFVYFSPLGLNGPILKVSDGFEKSTQPGSLVSQWLAMNGESRAVSSTAVSGSLNRWDRWYIIIQ